MSANVNYSTKLPLDQVLLNIRNPFISPDAQRRQLDLVRKLNVFHSEKLQKEEQLESRIESFEMAFRMQTEATDAFDVSKESKATLEAYGPGTQARQLLIARRLIERGVRFVQLWHGAGQPWDNHDDIEVNHRNLARQCDQAIGALLKDLKQRGMLDDTLVIWGGEFGRTPTAEGTDGREHHPFGFSMWLAGGGVRGGMTHGATDEFGWHAQQDIVHVHDLHATILHLMGFDHTRLTYRHAGRDLDRA
jgi:uncharacterized protein (DUF1501 family)